MRAEAANIRRIAKGKVVQDAPGAFSLSRAIDRGPREGAK
ncbi:hypothetical protein RS85_01980 [Microbacterium sp. SA39]|nr:hypothetical protein RS85_01980 [Microbacterium sp. SA39]